MKRVLNLYAGVGGNRKLWDDCDVVAIENDQQIAEAYQQLYPQDTMIVTDAHQYLKEHLLDGWDFIWSSPPCQSHSKLQRFIVGNHKKLTYPDLEQLYGEIILLQSLAPPETAWCVENVIPYYQPLIPPTSILGRHYAWANRALPHISATNAIRISRERRQNNSTQLSRMRVSNDKEIEEEYSLHLPACADNWGYYKRRQVMRNCVDPLIGKALFDTIFGATIERQYTLLDVMS